MARHNLTGKAGEVLALAFFQEKGYEILFRNWRHKHWEVDLIADFNGILHFIEVKTRSSTSFGFPEDNVDEKKITYLINASEEFLIIQPQWQRIQFDILAIIINNNQPPNYMLIEDVYL